MCSSARCDDATAGADAWFRADFSRSAGQRFDLSHATAEHELALLDLFGENLAEQVVRVGGDPAPIASGPLLDLQFRARKAAYASAHPRALDYVVSRRTSAAVIGRFLVDWSRHADEAVWGIDLAVRPAERSGAAGLHVLRSWVKTCDWLGRPAWLHVLPHNPARCLYRRLGFVEAGTEQSFPLPMRREPRPRGAGCAEPPPATPGQGRVG